MLLARFAYPIAHFFGSGLSPLAPGTVGSLTSLALWIPASLFLSYSLYGFLVLAVFLIGLLATHLSLRLFPHDHDPKSIVIDEVVGMGIMLFGLKLSVFKVLLAFLLFRFFDIVKPGPVAYLERRFPNAFGVMIDDVAAAILGWLVLQTLLIIF